MGKNKTWIIWLLLLILVSALFLRSYRISTLPSGIFPDEAQNGVDAQQANATGDYKLFYETNQGREGLFINLQALSIKVLGNTVVGLKIWSIIFGTLTVLGVFLLASELFRNQVAGLVGAYLTAFSYWAINFSRIGFRAIMLPFILVFAFYFLFKGLRTKRYLDFILAGFIYGLGLHTYIAFRVSPLILVVIFISLIISRRKFLNNYWKYIVAFAIFMLIASAPMILDFFIWHPEHFISRTSQVSVFNPEANGGHLVSTIAETFGLALAKYNFIGDKNWRSNYPPYPILNPLTGVAFLIGLIYILIKFFRFKFAEEKWIIYAFLLAWFFAMLIPEFLAAEGNPHTLRSIGTLPAVMIMATVPFIWIFNKLPKLRGKIRTVVLSALIVVFGFIGIFDTAKYFVFFADNPKQHEAFDEHLTDTAYYANSLSPSTEKYIVAEEYALMPIEFLSAETKNIFYTWPSHIEYINPQNKNFVILLADPQVDSYQQIKKRFPNLKIYEHKKSENNFYVEFRP